MIVKRSCIKSKSNHSSYIRDHSSISGITVFCLFVCNRSKAQSILENVNDKAGVKKKKKKKRNSKWDREKKNNFKYIIYINRIKIPNRIDNIITFENLIMNYNYL